MTLSELTTNREWNTKIVSKEQCEYTQNVMTEFNHLWMRNIGGSTKHLRVEIQ